jgi:hypothetical protein
MKYPVSATLHDPKTGVRKTFDYHPVEADSLPDARHIVWLEWTQGNFSCDCNRSFFLYEDTELPCGDTIQLVKLTVGGEDVEL